MVLYYDRIVIIFYCQFTGGSMRLSKARKEFVTAMMKDTIFEAAGSVLERARSQRNHDG